VKPLFTPLSETASPEVIRIASRDLLAYFEVDEPEFIRHFGKAYYFRGCRPRRTRIKCVPIKVGCE